MSDRIPGDIEMSGEVKYQQGATLNQQELTASLLQGSKMILEFPDFTVSAKKLFEKCRRLTHATGGFISVIVPETRHLKVLVLEKTGWCEQESGNDLSRLFSGFIAGVISGKVPVLVNDFGQMVAGELVSPPHPSVRNMLMAPMIHNRTVTGLLVLVNKPDDYIPEDVAAAAGFAELLALALNAARNLDELRNARRKAEEGDRLKSAFLSNMSHEIRTPLNGILGFAELLAEPDLAAGDRDQYIRIMRQNGDQLMSIINDILDISLIESGQIVLVNEWVDIRSLLQEVYELFMSPGLHRSSAEYLLNCELSDRRMIYADHGRLKQVLVNLFGNAAKFTQSGYVLLGSRIREGLNGRELVLFVEDTGIGISAEKLGTIFDRFTQAESNTRRNYGGTGLGLAISRGLTGLLGGRIEVISQPGKGSTFSVVFPLSD
jgi:signal transduction histidine kinase